MRASTHKVINPVLSALSHIATEGGYLAEWSTPHACVVFDSWGNRESFISPEYAHGLNHNNARFYATHCGTEQ